jgi:hypothetical protein
MKKYQMAAIPGIPIAESRAGRCGFYRRAGDLFGDILSNLGPARIGENNSAYFHSIAPVSVGRLN